MRCWFAFSFLAAVAAGTTASSAQTAADRLNMFVGTWDYSGTTTISESAKPAPTRGSNSCSWSGKAHIFLVCDGTFFTGGDPTPHHQLSVYSYDAVSKQYEFININTSFATSPDLTFEGNTWTYLGKYTNKAAVTTYYRTVNIFDTPDEYRYISEESHDNVHWTQTASGTGRRAP